ncbi:MAG: hypothetical protein O3C40_28350 [Planctomycetota bacterium]|nr:hypothetical protein [Planctomycetota bacterium]
MNRERMLNRLRGCYVTVPIGNGELGPLFTRLLDAWKQSVGIDFVAQARDYAERLPAWEQEKSDWNTKVTKETK